MLVLILIVFYYILCHFVFRLYISSPLMSKSIPLSKFCTVWAIFISGFDTLTLWQDLQLRFLYTNSSPMLLSLFCPATLLKSTNYFTAQFVTIFKCFYNFPLKCFTHLGTDVLCSAFCIQNCIITLCFYFYFCQVSIRCVIFIYCDHLSLKSTTHHCVVKFPTVPQWTTILSWKKNKS